MDSYGIHNLSGSLSFTEFTVEMSLKPDIHPGSLVSCKLRKLLVLIMLCPEEVTYKRGIKIIRSRFYGLFKGLFIRIKVSVML